MLLLQKFFRRPSKIVTIVIGLSATHLQSLQLNLKNSGLVELGDLLLQLHKGALDVSYKSFSA